MRYVTQRSKPNLYKQFDWVFARWLRFHAIRIPLAGMT